MRRAEVREALALASPDLAVRIDPWLHGELGAESEASVERALLKYLGRMSSRSTPFGLFAGVSMGGWAACSRLEVAPWRACRKTVRLDGGLLEALVDRLEREPEVRAGVVYRPNTSLYLRAGWYRYLEHRTQAGQGGRSYHLEAVEATPHLEHVLQQAQLGCDLAELTRCLARHAQVELADARAFLDQLIEAQVLCGELRPPLSHPDPLGHLAGALQAHPETRHRSESLLSFARALKAVEAAAIGTLPEGYGQLLPRLADLDLSSNARDIVQADLFRPAPGLTLSPVVRRALEQGAETLRRLTPPPLEGPMEHFRAAFQERYGAQWRPLLEVLDEESGLGFDGGVPLDSPLLEGLPFGRPAAARAWTSRDQVLLTRLARRPGGVVWELDTADLEALSHPEPRPFPPSFAALACLAAPSLEALDQGDFQFWMEHHSGPSAARWLGRFAAGDPELLDALRRHLRMEEAARPEAVFAEVIHVPEGRMGNVLARPALRDHEIPFLAPAGVAPDHVLLPADLLVTVRGSRVLLASRRLGREVVPRVSSAHNFAHGPVVYRFLAHLQDQDGRPGGWSWGALEELPFLPRVTCGRQVLTKARWRIEAQELEEARKAAPGGSWAAFQHLREHRQLPRLVQLTDADNTLLVDLDAPHWVETLHHLVARRPSFLLSECFPEPAEALVSSPEGRYAHELVLPFEALAPGRLAMELPPLPAAPSRPRLHPPGSEWLYLKLYCGPASADRLLVELGPLLQAARAEDLCDRWHFIRYWDPEHHLRLRLHGDPRQLLAEVLPRCHRHLEGPLASGLLWRWQVDTFEPEWERYGGAHGFDLAEAWFAQDSQHVLELLTRGLDLDGRWRVGLRQVDAIWAALGLAVPARRALADQARQGFRREFGDAGQGAVQMGITFRGLRNELARAFPAESEAPLGPSLQGLAPFREAFGQGLIQAELAEVAGSLSHMHLNRLLRSHQREHEWVLMEFLVRLYDSWLARGHEAGGPSKAGRS